MRLVLASMSPARLATLRQAGLRPDVIYSDVEEDGFEADSVAELTAVLAREKGEAVVEKLGTSLPEPTVIVACDSMLELDGHPWGKPLTDDEALARWYRMRGRSATLHTGHHIVLVEPGGVRRSTRVASTLVTFADLTDAEIGAYVATGEPQRVAGAFTIDGWGGAFVTRVEGDPHNVVGISLPLVRQMLIDFGIAWHTLWQAPSNE
ncbi:MAG TPA: Maf family protein [Propionibacteriaceae bacterium]|nr:Maf family protein [Propionibacteriaceae bacterium]